jgi:TRAP transporter TAXI family solute receptor
MATFTKLGKLALVILTLILVVAVTSCSTTPAASPTSASPAKAATTATTTATSAVASTSAAATSSTTQAATTAAAHPKVEIKIHTGTPGTVSHVVATAIVDLLAKKHPWLRASVVVTEQSADAVKKVAQDPAMRKTGIFSVNSTIHNNVVTGQGDFTSPIDYRILALIRSDAMSMVTINPNIKSMTDLNGKTVSVGTKGGPGPVYEALLKAYGIKPASIEYLTWDPAKEAMIAGKVDAGAQTLGDTSIEPYAPPAVVKQLQAQKGFNVITMDKGMIQKVSEITPIGYVEVPSKVFGTPIVAMANKTSWGACPEFDPEIAYEFTKFMAENAGSFKDYDASLANITKANLANLPIPTVTLHPGAEKYYKEAGIKIGQ